MTGGRACRRAAGRALRGAAMAGAAAILVAGPAPAADGDGRYAVDGAGRAACSDFLAARDAVLGDGTAGDGTAGNGTAGNGTAGNGTAGEDKAGDAYRVYGGWIEGYVSAFNHFQPDTFDLTPWQTPELLAAKLARYCRTAPEARFNAALNLLAQTLYDQRLKTASPLVQLRASGQAVTMYRAMLPRIHGALVAAGHDPGPREDQFTGAMAAALKAYQTDKALPASGLPDQPTLNSLFP